MKDIAIKTVVLPFTENGPLQSGDRVVPQIILFPDHRVNGRGRMNLCLGFQLKAFDKKPHAPPLPRSIGHPIAV